MILPRVGNVFDRITEENRNRVLKQADAENHKRNRDVEIGNGRLILTSPNGTRWNITVSNAGAISATSL